MMRSARLQFRPGGRPPEIEIAAESIAMQDGRAGVQQAQGLRREAAAARPPAVSPEWLAAAGKADIEWLAARDALELQFAALFVATPSEPSLKRPRAPSSELRRPVLRRHMRVRRRGAPRSALAPALAPAQAGGS